MVAAHLRIWIISGILVDQLDHQIVVRTGGRCVNICGDFSSQYQILLERGQLPYGHVLALRYKALVFDNPNNEIVDNEEQKAAFQRYIRAGGGFVGIHSASGSMRQWPWFWSVVGGKFSRHAKMQKVTVKVKDPKDVSTVHLPATFEWTDEFYYVEHMPAGLHVLLAGELTNLDDPGKDKYPGKMFGDEFPLAWHHQFDGGREWYTALGHKPEHYSDPRFTQHILGGVLWAMGEGK